MPKTPESKLKDKVRAYLKTLKNCWFFKVHGSLMQMTGTPDYLVVHKGVFYAIELKIGKNTTTKIQRYVLSRIAEAGGVTAVCRSVSDVREIMKDKP